jgi:pimeloyl-ACP methyl ester carboxylesterase
MEAALQLPALGRLILYEPPLPTGSGMVSRETREKIERLVASGEREEALRCFFREVVGASDAELDLLKTHPAWQARVAAAHTITREADAEELYGLNLSRLGALKVPTLLLVGGESPAHFREAVARIHSAIPRSVVQELSGQQHIAMDTAPELFVEAVATFGLSGDGNMAGASP